MLISVNPSETVWRTWSEIQRERIRLDRAAAEEKRREAEARLAALKDLAAEAKAAALTPFDDLLARLADEEKSLPSPSTGEGQGGGGEPAFQVGHIAWKIRSRVRALYAPGRIEDACQAVELLVRHGCRGHRNLKDAAGADVPFRFESSAGSFPILDEATFETYAASGIAEALAAVILDYNIQSEARRKN